MKRLIAVLFLISTVVSFADIFYEWGMTEEELQKSSEKNRKNLKSISPLRIEERKNEVKDKTVNWLKKEQERIIFESANIDWKKKEYEQRFITESATMRNNSYYINDLKEKLETDRKKEFIAYLEKIKSDKQLSNIFLWIDKTDKSKYFLLMEKRYWTTGKKKNYGFGHIADYVAQYRYGVITLDGKEVIPPVLNSISQLYNGKARIQAGNNLGWVYLPEKVEWDNGTNGTLLASENIKLSLITDEEKLKLYRKENVFRTVSYPIDVADLELIRGDNMKQENGYRTGIFINGKEKIVPKKKVIPMNDPYFTMWGYKNLPVYNWDENKE
jgi:hypothetical protein